MTKIYTLLLILLAMSTLTASEIVITDADLTASSNVTWTADNEYLLDGYVFLEEGGVLTIEPGTVIKGKASPSGQDNASALIITRGAQILASGTSAKPIIFTSELDDLTDNSELNSNDKGLWGGLIILGYGVVGVDGGEQNIEGIPSTEGRALYGGSNNDDNSGVLQYVSIRHGGTALESNNEINGLTLGAVGSGTLIDYVEIYANKDDGIEWFGGAVSIKHAVVSFCGDDSFDFDQSWGGNGQFWLSVQDAESNRAGEWDGSEASDLNPKTALILSNATFIGAGDVSNHEDGNDALRIRDAGAAEVYNSIMIDFVDRAFRIDDDFEGDSYDRLLDGDIKFSNNVIWNFKAGSDFDALSKTTDANDKTVLVEMLNANNSILNPGMGGISRTPDGGLDPRVSAGSVLFEAATTLEDSWFDEVDYIGAFNNNSNWALEWTALDEYGYFGDKVTTSTVNNNSAIENLEVYPNPYTSKVTVNFELAETKEVDIEVLDLNGQIVYSKQVNGSLGSQTAQLDLSKLNTGFYIVTLRNANELLGIQRIIKN